MSFSEYLWGFGICPTKPTHLNSDLVVVAGSVDSAIEYLAAEFPSFAEKRTTSECEGRVKRAFFEHSDIVELKDGKKTVGVIIGNPEDWCTYYVRAFAMSRFYRRPLLTKKFATTCLFNPLTYMGVARVTADTSPTNTSMTRALLETGFYATGNNISERYGSLIRYTKFLDEAAHAEFLSRFGGTTPNE